MTAHPLSLTSPASVAAVFRELADIENFPRWAAEFCERIELSADGNWRALTIQGDLHVELEADARTGVIDLRLGDGARCMGLLPLRVLALPGGRTLVSAVLIPAPGLGDFAFARQVEVFETALRGLLTRLERAAAVPGTPCAVAV